MPHTIFSNTCSSRVRAPHRGVSFYLRILLTLIFPVLMGASLSVQADCTARHIDRPATVARVYDGDTFELTDGTRIRFIGINTPEMARDERPAEPYANQAYQAVVTLLRQHDEQVLLQYGTELHDHYGRTLAHVFLPDGTNLSEWLLLQGLATRIAIPPNLWGQDCYARAEAAARRKGMALWPDVITPSRSVRVGSRGYYVIEGKVERIGHSRKSIWLNLPGAVAIRIARKDLDNFSNIAVDSLQNHTVRARGWIFPGKNQSTLRIRHSAMLEIVK